MKAWACIRGFGALAILMSAVACQPPGGMTASGSPATASTPLVIPSPGQGPTGPGVASPAPAPTPAPARASNAANETVCPGQQVTPGLDVSNYDPATQWAKVKTSGRMFAFIKATEGITYTSPQFASDWVTTKAAGLIRGPYHYFHPADNPSSSAQAFLRVVGALAATDLPPVLDWETTDGVSNQEQINNALVWLQDVQAATGKTPIVYIAPDFWNALGNPQGFARYPLYVAEYEVNCPRVPPPWSDWLFWQSSDSGTVNGVNNKADLDTFNGTLLDLTSLISNGI